VRASRATAGLEGSKPLRYDFDRHGDIIEIDDDCGATAIPTDQFFGRSVPR